MSASRGEKLYEGKAKVLYATDDPGLVIQYFKDDATAFNGVKKGQILEKGVVNCHVSSFLFEYLAEKGIESHFVERLSDREMLVRRVGIVPLEVVVRNVVAGSLSKRMGLPEGQVLDQTIVELYYKRDDLGDPMVNEDHARVFQLATDDELAQLRRSALSINDHLKKFMKERGILLVDFKLEFGRFEDRLLLADEISADGSRLWDIETGERLDKDRFRRDLGRVEESYWEVFRRILGEDRRSPITPAVVSEDQS